MTVHYIRVCAQSDGIDVKPIPFRVGVGLRVGVPELPGHVDVAFEPAPLTYDLPTAEFRIRIAAGHRTMQKVYFPT